MRSVLISIQPKWCAKIASGEKTVEVRKTKPNIDTPFKCYIYCTLNGSNELFREVLGGDIAAWNRGKWSDRKGMVIGEFVCDEIRDCREVFIEPTCLTVVEWLKYTDGYKRAVWGWHISELKIYDKPKQLSDFERPCKCLAEYEGEIYCDCLNCDDAGDSDYGITACDRKQRKPPQSWCYVEEIRL